MGAGVFERYPRLRVAFGESGAGWLAYALRHGFRVRGSFPRSGEAEAERILAAPVQGDLPVRPDRHQARRRHRCRDPDGGSDYPHTDGVWPESSKYIEEQFAGLAPDVVHKITCENAAKFYGLIN